MPKLIIIRGNSASGKSTIAKRLQNIFGRNTLMISQDMIRREMLWVNDGMDTPAIRLLEFILEYGYDHHEITILEGILNSKWYEPLFDKAVERYGKENIFAFYYDLPFEETVKRHGTRSKRSEFGEAALSEWWNEKDHIGSIAEDMITAEKSEEETVEWIVSKVR
ncbi:MAG: uridine kinase [Peptostreptococcaceae bacterium]|nr:uridine kinase [Peptostreptococcaceae bacterium]